jgi:hypothetical protein
MTEADTVCKTSYVLNVNKAIDNAKRNNFNFHLTTHINSGLVDIYLR